MATIYKLTDIINLKIDGLIVSISPLSFEQKMQIQQELFNNNKDSAMRAAALAIRFALKDIKGITQVDGSPYQLKKENGILTLETWDELQNLQIVEKLTAVCLLLLNGVPETFLDHRTGKQIKGVTVVKDEVEEKK